jgi:hypothetical protein
MATGTTLKVEAKGPDNGTLELEYSDNGITVYGWTGSVVTITETGTAEAGPG